MSLLFSYPVTSLPLGRSRSSLSDGLTSLSPIDVSSRRNCSQSRKDPVGGRLLIHSTDICRPVKPSAALCDYSLRMRVRWVQST